MEKKSIVLLGSSGSIGKQTLDVARTHGFRVKALAVNSSIKLLSEQAREFKPEYVCVYDKNKYNELKLLLSDTEVKVTCGMEGLKILAAIPCNFVVNAIVGMIGLEPTLSALENKNNVALANKETLVAGGELVMSCARKNNLEIIPIDSEHSAILQCLMGNTSNKISKIILTASGGAFHGFTEEQLKNVTKSQALKHPNWNMGQKITIDSASLMNKGLEFIEAIHLFGVTTKQIEVIIHRQSIIHSAVEFEDGAVIAQLGVPDMRVPIQYALTYPQRLPSSAKKMSFSDIKNLTFDIPDYKTFTCLKTAIEAIEIGGNAPVLVNSANEEAVKAFLEDRIKFYDIFGIVGKVLHNIKHERITDLNSIYQADFTAREFVRNCL